MLSNLFFIFVSILFLGCCTIVIAIAMNNNNDFFVPVSAVADHIVKPDNNMETILQFSKPFGTGEPSECKCNKELQKIDKARQEKARLQKRTALYGKRSNIKYDSYELKTNDSKHLSFSVVQTTNMMQESEFTRSLVDTFGLEAAPILKAYQRKTYEINKFFQIKFPNGFKKAESFLELWDVDGNLYYRSLASAKATGFRVGSLKRNTSDDDTNNEFYICLTNSKLSLDSIPENAIKYFAVSHSASGNRHYASLYVVDDSAIVKAINKGSNGMLSEYEEANEEGGYKDTQSAAVRIWSQFAPSSIGGTVNAICIYADQFGFGKLRGLLDGSANGTMTAQTRLGSSKVFLNGNACFDEKVIEPTIHVLEALGIEVVTLIKNKITKTDKINLRLMYKGKGDFVGKLIVIKTNNDDKVGYFSDLNGFKKNFDVTKAFTIPVLAFPKPSKANTSKQILIKAIAAHPEQAMNWIMKTAKKLIDNTIDGLYRKQPVSVRETCSPFMDDIIRKVSPDYMKHDFSFKLSVARLTFKSLAQIINVFKLPVKDSTINKLIPDYSGIFGFRVLQENECVSRSMQDNTLTLAFRHPSPQLEEFIRYTARSVDTVIARIKALDFNTISLELNNDQDMATFRTSLVAHEAEVKAILIYFYKSLDLGSVILGLSETNMNINGGFDYDFDDMSFFWDKEFVALFDGVKSVRTIVDTTEEKEAMKDQKKTWVINLKNLYKPLFRTITEGSNTVGSATRANEFWLFLKCTFATLQADRKDAFCRAIEALIDVASIEDKNEVKKHLEKLESVDLPEYRFGEKKPNLYVCEKINKPKRTKARVGNYVGLEEVGTCIPGTEIHHITTSKKNLVKDQASRCKFDLTSIERFFNDAQRIGAFVINVTVDSAKTTIESSNLFNVVTFFDGLGNKPYQYTVEEDGAIVRNAIELKKRYFFYDAFAQLRDQLEDYILPKMQGFINNDNLGDNAIIDLLGDFSNSTCNAEVRSCFSVTSMYGTLMTHMMGLETITEIDNSFKKLAFEGFYNMIRSFLKDSSIGKDLNTRIMFENYLAYYRIGENKQHERKVDLDGNYTHSKFGLRVCWRDAALFTAAVSGKNDYDKTAMVSEPILYILDDYKEGMEVYVDTNGDIYDINTRENIGVARNSFEKDGNAILTTINDQLYLSCDLIEHVSSEDYDKNLVIIPIEGHFEFAKDAPVVIGYDRTGKHRSTKITVDGTVVKQYLADETFYENIRKITSKYTVLDSYQASIKNKEGNTIKMTFVALFKLDYEAYEEDEAPVMTDIEDYSQDFDQDEEDFFDQEFAEKFLEETEGEEDYLLDIEPNEMF